MTKYQLSFYDPGHFHAALLLGLPNERIGDTIHLYGPDRDHLDAFETMVQDFNRRADNPTRWRINRIEGCNGLQRLRAERPGDCVVLAGKNAQKLKVMADLHGSGFPLLVDKPWITRSEDLPLLKAVLAGPPLAMDIMTTRLDRLACLRRAIIGQPDLFGAFISGDAISPALEIGSIHHLMKIANGKPLRRPAWYYDVNVQGTGLVDIQSHMTDQAQWLVATQTVACHPFSFEQDISDLSAEAWATDVPLDLFCESTGRDRFPDSLLDRVEDKVLSLDCNGLIRYRLRGHMIQQQAEWRLREPEGGGDIHHFVARGTRASLSSEHPPARPSDASLLLTPVEGAKLGAAADAAIQLLKAEFTGLHVDLEGAGLRFSMDKSTLIPHEAQFPLVLDQFLDCLDGTAIDHNGTEQRAMRYKLLAAAHYLVQGPN